MCFFSSPSMPQPPAPPPPLPPAPTEADPGVKLAREDAKRRTAAMAGYGSTIATSGLGVTAPAPNTTATSGGKTLLGA